MYLCRQIKISVVDMSLLCKYNVVLFFSVRIRCRELVKKVSVYKKRLAVSTILHSVLMALYYSNNYKIHVFAFKYHSIAVSAIFSDLLLPQYVSCEPFTRPIV